MWRYIDAAINHRREEREGTTENQVFLPYLPFLL
jgi:hypothetical protein